MQADERRIRAIETEARSQARALPTDIYVRALCELARQMSRVADALEKRTEAPEYQEPIYRPPLVTPPTPAPRPAIDDDVPF